MFKPQVNVKAKMEKTLLEDKMQITKSNLSAVIGTLTLSGFHLLSELQVYKQCTVCPEIYITDEAFGFL